MRYILVLIFVFNFAFAKNVSPAHTYVAKGAVTDIVLVKDTLYASTSLGTVEVYDTKSKKKKISITLPTLINFYDEENPAKVYSIDVLKDKILILAEGEMGSRELYLYDGKLTKILDAKKRLTIKKAKFLDEYSIAFATLASEYGVFDMYSKKVRFIKQVSGSMFSDFQLNESKEHLAFTCESGEVFLLKAQNGVVERVFKGQNVDNIYKVDFKNNKIIGAGQDRRVSFYDISSKLSYYLGSEFLVYSVALSPDASLGAYAMNEKNDIGLFKTSDKSLQYVLQGQRSTLNTILFINKKYLLSASDDKYILEWRLP